MVGVISGQDLKDVRARSNLTTKQLAEVLDESMSTVNRWLTNGVRPEKEAKVRERLAPWLPPTEPDRYTQMSDAAILAELNRLLGIIGQRLADREALRKPEDSPSTRVGENPDSTHERYDVSDTVRGDTTAEEANEGSTTKRAGSARIKGRGPRITK